MEGNLFNKTINRSVQYTRGQIEKMGIAVVLVVIALVILALIVVYLLLKIRRVTTLGSLIVGSPLQLYNMSNQAVVADDKIPKAINGQEFSFSFWLYIVNLNQTNGPQLIFLRGGDGKTLANGNPIVALDGKTNQMYISVKTNKSGTATSTNFYQPRESKYLTATINYVPLQRWIQVVGVVKDSLLSVYMNSSLYVVSDVSDIMVADPSLLSRPVFSQSTGNVYVGGQGFTSVDSPMAYIANFNFYNYAISSQMISSQYQAGPSSTTFLNKIGLSGYGFRSPIYKT